MNYLDRIKQIKKEKGITNEELVRRTGIPLGTLSKLLAGLNESPKFVNIVSICEALGCDLTYIVTGVPRNENNYTLTAEEIDFIESYRRLDSHSRELLAMVAKKEEERACDTSTDGVESASGKILRLPDAHNDPAQERKAEVSYTGQSAVPLKRRIKLYEMAVSAGCGTFLDDDTFTEITIPDTAKSSEADFALRISGNSMEPRYKNGDYLLVKSTDTIEVGETGVFMLDGEGYVKVYGGDCLISLNPAYAPIPLKDFTSVRCAGVVTGKLKKR